MIKKRKGKEGTEMAVTTYRTRFGLYVLLNAERHFVDLAVDEDGNTYKAEYGAYRAVKNIDCPVCGAKKACRTDGEFATGERLLSGSTPRPHELVRNHYSECRACGWEQAS
jgi:hypothetical protein